MPNHVTTRCIVTGPSEEVARFRSQMILSKVDGKGEPYQQFDFEAIIPSPPILHKVEESGTSQYAARLIILRGERGAPFEKLGMYDVQIRRIREYAGLPDDTPMHEVAAAYLSKYPEEEAAGRLRLRAILETGYASWYPWNIENWGTKWNAYQTEVLAEEPFEFSFQTAWNFPTPVFERLAVEFPSLQFECLSFDEGWNFAGEGCFNPREGKAAFQIGTATDELYERVYGEKFEREEEEAAVS